MSWVNPQGEEMGGDVLGLGGIVVCLNYVQRPCCAFVTCHPDGTGEYNEEPGVVNSLFS